MSDISLKINAQRGSAETYRVWVKDRNGKLLNLTGWTCTVTVKVKETDAVPVFTSPCSIDPTNPAYVLMPIEGDATATARKLVGYVQCTHPSGKPIDGIPFVLVVEEHA